mmetsp:Transcript_19451/g.47025  ORF Transcript_19451/g.47025 Transcript_19451/m.47025 type:complete len:141 (+) Transcript_19451:547-969(+)
METHHKRTQAWRDMPTHHTLEPRQTRYATLHTTNSILHCHTHTHIHTNTHTITHTHSHHPSAYKLTHPNLLYSRPPTHPALTVTHFTYSRHFFSSICLASPSALVGRWKCAGTIISTSHDNTFVAKSGVLEAASLSAFLL